MNGGGALAAEFSHVVFKRLSAVEADSARSNQHEFNAPKALRDAFGLEQPRRIDTDFVWMPDDGDFLTEQGLLTWYDSRARHPTRSEYRLYYRDNAVTANASAGDLLLLAIRPDGNVLLILAPGTGLAAARIAWLFGIEAVPGAGFAALDIDSATGQSLAARLGATVSVQAIDWEEDISMSAGGEDEALRSVVGQAQRQIGLVAANFETSWEDVVLTLHSQPPSGLGGIGLERTVRGVLAPRTDGNRIE